MPQLLGDADDVALTFGAKLVMETKLTVVFRDIASTAGQIEISAQWIDNMLTTPQDQQEIMTTLEHAIKVAMTELANKHGWQHG